MKPAEQLKHAALGLSTHLTPDKVASTIEQPVIILSAPRSGSTLLFEFLGRQNGYWNIGGESHIIYASMPHLRFENSDKDSSSLGEQHADAHTSNLFRASLLYLARDHMGSPYINLPEEKRPEHIRLVEKTPRNALNIPFLRRIFPRARYIYLHRDPRQNIASIMEGWILGLQTGRFATYPDLPDWDRNNWCFLLPRNWRTMRGKSIAQIAAFQWAQSNRKIIDQLVQMPKTQSLCLDYKNLTESPVGSLKKINQFLGIGQQGNIEAGIQLPLSATTTSAPNTNKWKAHEAAIDAQIAELEPLINEVEAFGLRD